MPPIASWTPSENGVSAARCSKEESTFSFFRFPLGAGHCQSASGVTMLGLSGTGAILTPFSLRFWYSLAAST